MIGVVMKSIGVVCFIFYGSRINLTALNTCAGTFDRCLWPLSCKTFPSQMAHVPLGKEIVRTMRSIVAKYALWAN